MAKIMAGLTSQKVLVTGGSSGLGLALVRRFLAEGAEVWTTSRDGARLPAGVRALPLDLSSQESVDRFLARIDAELPNPDVVINNAGAGAFFPADEFPPGEERRQVDILLTAPIALSRHFYGKFRRAGRGTLVNVTSLAGAYPIPFMSVYSAAKAGLSSYTETLMLESAGSGVVVIDFRPGDVATGFNAAMPGFGVASRPEVGRAAAACDRHVNAGASAESVAAELVRAVARGRSGVVVAGTFWQAKLGPIFARFAPRAWVRRYLIGYYDIR